MSASATPIPPERFAEAILDLPLANLHFKAAEIRNSVAHLESSNSQLQSFADEGDKVCIDAIKENEQTMMRMAERILLLRREVERRGFQWGEDVDLGSPDGPGRINNDKAGDMEIEEAGRNSQAAGHQPRPTSGIRGNEGSACTLSEGTNIDEGEDGEGNGIHL